MHLIGMGMSFRNSPVELREKVSVDSTELEQALLRLQELTVIRECVIVSTCNRTELYAVVNDIREGVRHAVLWFKSRAEDGGASLHDALEQYVDGEAVSHLFEVAAGLDSMVIGETQILGQVRDAHRLALACGTAGTLLDNLFRRAVTAAKRCHTETGLSSHAVSVSYAAMELVKRVYDQLVDKTVLIIGAGKMGELTAKHIQSGGVRRVFVANRTYEKAVELATRFEGTALPLDLLEEGLREADIVISSTGSAGYVVTRDQVARIMQERKRRPLFLIDIAVPRDLDPAINDLRNVFLYDIDDLQEVVTHNLEERNREAAKARVILAAEMALFEEWKAQQDAVPLITALREKGSQIQQTVVDSLFHKLPNLSNREREVIEKHTMSIVNQLLRAPVTQLKELATEPGAQSNLEVAARLLGVEGALLDKMREPHASNLTGAGAQSALKRQAEGSSTAGLSLSVQGV